MQFLLNNASVLTIILSISSSYAVSKHKADYSYQHVSKHANDVAEIRADIRELKSDVKHIKEREREIIATLEKQTEAINKLSRIVAAESGSNKFD